jgi:hypothetical protein
MSNPTTMRAEVYKNLHTGTWSVRDLGVGRVVAHPLAVVIADADFVVRKAGRARVLREKRKNVHAFIRGTILDMYIVDFPDNLEELDKATYNPYNNETFVDSTTGHPITSSKLVYMDVLRGLYYLK